MSLYLEISPRATGKTHRLILAAINYLEEHPSNKVNIVSFNRVANFIRDNIGLYIKFNIKEKVLINANLTGVSQVRSFYDEFDYLDLKEIDYNGYYCSSASKIRTIQDIKKKEDFLIKLLNYTNGKYISYTSFPMLDIQSINYCLEAASHRCKSLEFENHFIKY